MKNEITKEELFEMLPICLSRLAPQVITEIGKPEIQILFQKALSTLAPYVLLEQIESPKQLFHFLKAHQDALIVVKADIFLMRKKYLDIMEGAVCSSPDSMTLWKVRYMNQPEFTFKGKLILCTNKTVDEIRNNPKWEYFARDCEFT